MVPIMEGNTSQAVQPPTIPQRAIDVLSNCSKNPMIPFSANDLTNIEAVPWRIGYYIKT